MFKDAKGCQYRQNNANHTKTIQKLVPETYKASFKSVNYITGFNLAKRLKYLKLSIYKPYNITIENEALFMTFKKLNI